MKKIMFNKSLLISLLKKFTFLIVTTYLFFNVVTIYTASLEGYLDGCDSYGFPLTYKSNCELDNFYSIQNLILDIGFAMVFSILLLLGEHFLLKINQSLKNKTSIIFKIIALIIFASLIIFSKLISYCHILSQYYFYIVVFVFYLFRIAHLLNPIKIKNYLLFLIGMIGYYFFIYYWAINYSYRKNFEFKGETLTYYYSPFNGSFDKLFNYKSSNNQTNEYKQKRAIDLFLFLQCEYSESDQNYTPKQKENIKNGSLQIIHSHTYPKGEPKEFVVEAVKENNLYLNLYKHYTKQSKLQFESIIKYRYEIFNISRE
jgi:hypothetical protein